MTIVVCTPGDFTTAAEGLRRVHDTAATAVSNLAGLLKGCSGAAGSDAAGQAWSAQYDPAASQAMDAATTLVLGAGALSDLLHYTGVNHANAEAASVLDSPDAPAVPPDAVPVFPVPWIPAMAGGDAGGTPGWWSLVESFVRGHVWPNGHQDQLVAAGDAWKMASAGLREAASHVPAALALVEDQRSPEVASAVGWCTDVSTGLDECADQLDLMGQACTDYARNIDEAHHELISQGVEVVAESVAIAAVSVAATEFGGELWGSMIESGRMGAIGERIATFLDGFVVAAESSASPTMAAAGALARSATTLLPLVESAPLLEGTEEVIGTSLRRVTVRTGVRAQVESASAKTPDGKFYLSSTEPDVQIPVSKSYDGTTITSLPTDAKGQYYLDAANGLRYPVDPVYALGHQAGDEWWRIRELARTEGWTRQELNDYCQDPEIYRIEDRISNSSHLHELPREAAPR